VEVEAHIFKDNCLELLDDVRDLNRRIIVTEYGEPVAILTAADVEMPSAFGFMRGTIIGEEDIIVPDLDAW
jgi:antitoxin (DNA-binding transcriptional repressor) of toxin-antitoxin stability system